MLAIVATLLMLAVLRYFGSIDVSKEAVLRENLLMVRRIIDQFHADVGRSLGPPPGEAGLRSVVGVRMMLVI